MWLQIDEKGALIADSDVEQPEMRNTVHFEIWNKHTL
jgi:hypothetical protein